MFDSITEKLVALVLPLILAPIVTGLTQLSKQWVKWLDAQPAFVKQLVAAGWATGLTALAAAVGGSVCTDGGAFCDMASLDWRVILTWGVSLAIHGWKKRA